MINLAPHNKRGLIVRSPLLAGSGAVGFGDAWPPGVGPAHFGAIVTAPVSLRPRRGIESPRFVEIPGGFLFDTGGHNPGYRRLQRDMAPVWRRLGIPVILSVAAGDPGDRAWMAAHLEESDAESDAAIAGLELTAPEDVNLGELSASIAAVRRATTLPIWVKLPATRAAHLAETCIVAGADALIVGGPPPAAYPTADGELFEGALAGPAAFPFTLRALQQVAALALGAPMIAAGGIYTLDDIAYCFDAGAVAVQIRSLLWSDPAAVAALAKSVPALLPVDA